MTTRRQVVKAIGGIGLGITIAGCTEGSEKLEILSHYGEAMSYGGAVVTGTAKNVSDSTLRYAQIEVRYYDADDARIGSGLANVNDLQPDREWHFEAPCYSCDASRVSYYQISTEAY